jgi:hypothetical protein
MEATDIPGKVANRLDTFEIVKDVLDVGIRKQSHGWQESDCVALLMPEILTKCLEARGPDFDHFVCESLYSRSRV